MERWIVITDHHQSGDHAYSDAGRYASGEPTRPNSPREAIIYPTEPERASDGINDAIRMLESMTNANWQTSRDAALARLLHARPLIDRNILRTSERS